MNKDKRETALLIMGVVLIMTAIVSSYIVIATSYKPKFKPGDIIVDKEAERWQQPYASTLEVLEVGKNNYHLKDAKEVFDDTLTEPISTIDRSYKLANFSEPPAATNGKPGCSCPLTKGEKNAK